MTETFGTLVGGEGNEAARIWLGAILVGMAVVAFWISNMVQRSLHRSARRGEIDLGTAGRLVALINYGLVAFGALLAMAGDTLGARRRLETLFDTPDALGMDLFDDVALAAAWGRGVLLYRDLGGNLASRGLDSALTAIHRGATR